MLIDRLQALDSDLAGEINHWCDLAKGKLEQIEKNFEQYTDHGPGHCEAMLECLDWLVPSDVVEKLNPLEIALLLLAVYHHDIGMAWNVERRDTLMKEDPDWLADKDGLIDKFRHSKTVTDKSDKSLLDLAFVEWARKRHGEEAVQWIEENRIGEPDFRLKSYSNYDPWPDVAKLCKAHTMPTCDHLRTDEIRGPSGTQINLCFIGCALRLADICHITIDRVDPEVEKYIRFTDKYSRGKWEVHQRIMGVGQGNRVIMINAKPDFPAVHRAIATIAREIKSEIDKTNMTLSRKKSNLQIPWMGVDFETQVEICGPYKYRDWEFSLDQSKIYELLMGNKLYADNSVCIRELLQNAVDAVQARWGDETATKARITCRHYEKQRDDQIFEVIEVEDNGIGMDEEIIETNLLKVPSEPFYKTGRFRREHPKAAEVMSTPIAQFGIGFLSNFMVANTVEIFTRYDSPSKPAEPVHIELESLDKGVVYHEPVMEHFPEGVRLGSGTCIRIWLTKKLTDWPRSHKQRNWTSLEVVVRHWARRITPELIVEESGKKLSILPKKSAAPTNTLSIQDTANGISGYVNLFLDHNDPEARDMQVTVSGFYVEKSPLRKDLIGFWFPKGEIDFSGRRDFSLTVDRNSFAEFENSKTVRRAKELLAEAAIKWIRTQQVWDNDTKAKLRKLLYWNSVFDEYDELRKTVMELPLFRVGIGDMAVQDQSITEILGNGSAYFFLPIQFILRHSVVKSYPAGQFVRWYNGIIANLRLCYPLLHGTQIGSVQMRGGLNFQFASRIRHRQTYPLHFLTKLCNARLEFSEEGWPLVRLISLASTAQTTGWEYLLSEEPNKRDWLICSSHGGGYWINPHPPRKQGILEEGEDILGVYINRKRRNLGAGLAGGFLYPEDKATIIVEVNGEHKHKEFTLAKLGDLVHPFDRIDFWIEQFCKETRLSDRDRQELLKVFYVYDYRTDPDWSSPPEITLRKVK